MAISKRTLTKWRKEALVIINSRPKEGTIDATITHSKRVAQADRILLMTQELLDQELLKEANKDEG